MISIKKHATAVIFRKTLQNRYSLALVAAALEREIPSCPAIGIEKLATLKKFLASHPGLIVCYSFKTPDLKAIQHELQALRPYRKDSHVFIAGGPHPTADPEGTLALGFDALCIGEGDRAFPLFVKKLLDDRRIVTEEPIFSDPEPPPSIDDFLPFSRAMGKRTPIELSRGCFYHCAFCQTKGLFKGLVRHRSLPSLVRGAKMLDNLDHKRLFFISPNAFCYGASLPGKTDAGSLTALLEGLHREGLTNINLGTFPSEVRPDYVTDEMLMMVKKHCRNRKILLGIQTGSEGLMKVLRRGHSVSQAVSAVEKVAGHGFLPHCDFIFGFPDETEEDLRETFRLAEELNRRFRARVHGHYYLPLPGTSLWGAAPRTLSEGTRKKLRAMQADGTMDGWWEAQEKISESIMAWRKEGLIRV